MELFKKSSDVHTQLVKEASMGKTVVTVEDY